ncbi:MAG: PilW family protein [Sandaracinaceae bacterium]
MPNPAPLDPTPRRRSLRRRQGFTLIELMVALTLGGLIVAALFTLGGASSHHFQEQQRVGHTQQALRTAMDRLGQDLSRAGYGTISHPNAPGVNVCPSTPLLRPLPALWFDDDDNIGNTALDAVGRSFNRVSADRVRMIGNYATSDQYLVRGLNATGSVVFLQTDWLAFRRSFFVQTATGTVLDQNRFNDTFRAGRMLHLQTRGGSHLFVRITDRLIDATGTTASVTVSPAIGSNNPCIEGFGEGSSVTPISEVEYGIETAAPGSALVPRDVAVTGANTQLVRQELDMGSGAVLAGTRRPILDFAIDFNLDFIVDTNLAPGNPPNVQRVLGPAAEATVLATPWQVRGVIASLSGRSPDQDARFPWPDTWSSGRPSTAPLNRFQPVQGQRGASRVRSFAHEVHLPNLIPR